MDEQFIKVLFTALQGLGVQNREQFEQALQVLGEDGVSMLYEQYQKAPQDIEGLASSAAQIVKQKQQAVKAMRGAQLNYINQLRGKCPEGYEVEKFMSGGCVKCKKSKPQIAKCGTSVKNRFKKKQKMQDGNKIESTTTKNKATKNTKIDKMAKGSTVADDRPQVVKDYQNNPKSQIREIIKQRRTKTAPSIPKINPIPGLDKYLPKRRPSIYDYEDTPIVPQQRDGYPPIRTIRPNKNMS